MLITLHKNACTTPAIRAEIAASNESTRALAKRFGVSELTIAKWRKRASVNDLPHTPHRLQTTLSPAQEAIVVELRKSLLLPLDDLVAVTKEFICSKASRSGLDRATRWVFVQIMPSKSAANARKFLKALHEAYPIKIKHIPRSNSKCNTLSHGESVACPKPTLT